MISEYPSDIELYYLPELYSFSTGIITGDEHKHISKVMRHKADDLIYITNGKGKIFECIIRFMSKEATEVEVINERRYQNKLSDFIICIPGLRNDARLEFAFEKCTELGFTRFIVFNTARTITRKPKTERWNKIITAAMKQSLLSYLPTIRTFNSIQQILKEEGEKYLFGQGAVKQLSTDIFTPGKDTYLLFGPEGDLTKEETAYFNESSILKLTDNRLRTETAIITAASFISLNY